MKIWYISILKINMRKKHVFSLDYKKKKNEIRNYHLDEIRHNDLTSEKY